MVTPSLPADDLPPLQPGTVDGWLRRTLEMSLSRRFWAACNSTIHTLLIPCEWYFTVEASALTLVIGCPDTATNWRILTHIGMIGAAVADFSAQAKIRVCPPLQAGTPFEMRVSELSVYADPPPQF